MIYQLFQLLRRRFPASRINVCLSPTHKTNSLSPLFSFTWAKTNEREKWKQEDFFPFVFLATFYVLWKREEREKGVRDVMVWERERKKREKVALFVLSVAGKKMLFEGWGTKGGRETSRSELMLFEFMRQRKFVAKRCHSFHSERGYLSRKIIPLKVLVDNVTFAYYDTWKIVDRLKTFRLQFNFDVSSWQRKLLAWKPQNRAIFLLHISWLPSTFVANKSLGIFQKLRFRSLSLSLPDLQSNSNVRVC